MYSERDSYTIRGRTYQCYSFLRGQNWHRFVSLLRKLCPIVIATCVNEFYVTNVFIA